MFNGETINVYMDVRMCSPMGQDEVSSSCAVRANRVQIELSAQ